MQIFYAVLIPLFRSSGNIYAKLFDTPFPKIYNEVVQKMALVKNLFSSMRSRLTLLVFLAMIPAFGLAIYTSLANLNIAQKEAHAEALRVARSFAASQVTVYEGARQMLIAIAQSPWVARADEDVCNVTLPNLWSSLPQYYHIGIYGQNGEYICGTFPEGAVVNVADRSYFIRAQENQDFAIGDFQIGRISNKMGQGLAYPIFNNAHRSFGVVAVYLDTEWLNQLPSDVPVPAGYQLIATDSAGTILVHFPSPKYVGKPLSEVNRALLDKTAAQAREGVGTYTSDQNTRTIYAFTKLSILPEETGYVFVSVPEALVLAQAKRLLLVNVGVLSAALLLILGLAALANERWVLKPANKLVNATGRLASGDLSARTELTTTSREFNDLARSFDRMAASLEANQAALSESEGKLRSFIDQSLDAISLVDSSGKIIEWNPAAERTFKLSREQTIGEPFWEVVESLAVNPVSPQVRRKIDGLLSGNEDDVKLPPEFYPFLQIPFRIDGAVRYMQMIIFPVRSQHSVMLGNITRDITDQVLAQQALQERQARLDSIFRSNPAGLGVTIDRVFVEVNDYVCTISGYSRKELINQSTRFLYPTQADYDIIEDIQYKQISETGVGMVETRWKRKDGAIIDILISSSLIVPGDFSAGVTFAVVDITGRKRAEEALRDSEERYRQVFELGSDALFIIENAGGKILDVNAAAPIMYGYTREELLGLRNTDLSAEPEETIRATHLTEKVRGESVFIPLRYHRRKDGSVFPVEITGRFFVLDGRNVHVAAIRDITPRIEAEKALRDSEARFRRLAENAQAIILRMSVPEGRYEYVSPAVTRFTGYTPDEFYADPQLVRKLMHPDSQEYFLQEWEAICRGEGKPVHEFKIIDRSGDVHWFQQRVSYIQDEDGRTIAMEGVISDQTEFMLADMALRENEARLRLITDNMVDIIHQTNKDHRIVYMSPSVERVLGYQVEEFIGATGHEKIHPDDVERVLKEVKQTYNAHEPFGRYVFRMRHADGHYLWLETSAHFLYDEQGNYAGAFYGSRDISERVTVEESLALSNAKNTALILAIPDLMFNISRQGVYLDCHGEPDNLVAPPDELIGKNARDYLPPHIYELLMANIEQAFQTGEVQTYTYSLSLPRDNTVHSFEARLSVSGQDQVLVIVRDVTEKVNADMLQESLYTIAVMANSVENPDSLYRVVHEIVASLMPAKNLYVAIYDEARQMVTFPYSVDEKDVIPREYTAQEIGRGLTAYVIRTGQPLLANEERINELVARGEVERFGAHSASWLGVPLKTVMGKTVGALVVQTYDPNEHYTSRNQEVLSFAATQLAMVIERKMAEAALRRSEESYRSLVETSPDGIIVTNISGVIHFANQCLADMFGYENAVCMLGLNFLDFILPEEREVYRDNYNRVLQEGILRNERYHITRHDNSSLIQTAVSTAVARDNDGNPVSLVHIVRDITQVMQRDREREAVIAVAASLRTAGTRAEIAAALLKEVANLLQIEGAALILFQRSDSIDQPVSVIEFSTGVWQEHTGEIIDCAEEWMNEIESGRQFMTAEPSCFPIFPATDAPKDIQIVLCLPLKTQQETIGALCIASSRSLTDQDERMLAAISDMAANALQRSKLFEETQRNARHLGALHIIDLAINASVDMKVTLDVVLQQTVTQLDVDAAAIFTLQPGASYLQLIASTGLRSPSLANFSYNVSEGYIGLVARHRRMVGVPHLTPSNQHNPQHQLLIQEGYVAYYGVPLVSKGELKGVLEVYNRTPLASDSEWEDFLATLAGQAAIAIDNAELYQGLQRSNQDLTLAYDTTLEGWAMALELRDQETEGHSRRVIDLTTRLALMFGMHGDEIVHLRRGAILHDIGKMAVPDSILLKPGPLTDEEWVIMRRHPEYAYEMLAPINYLRNSLDIPYCHHEKWDGSGYPRGLKGEQIPRPARIFALVDVWDALTSDRPYRKAWTKEATLDYIRQQSGKHFDPQVVYKFIELMENG
jgi:PAS domain S-box-containing protein